MEYTNISPINEDMAKLAVTAYASVLSYTVHFQLLAKMAVDPSDEYILWHMALDEKKHQRLLEKIYRIFPQEKEELPHTGKPLFLEPVFLLNIEKTLFDKLELGELFRHMYFLCPSTAGKDICFELLTDEQSHAVKLNYLYAKYR